MIVMKFGGTSVESAAAIARVAGIVRERAARRPVVVVSAMGKTTNKLLEIANAAIAGKREQYIRLLHDLRDYHSREARLIVPLADVQHALENFRGVPQQKNLPSAPAQPVIYMMEANRPQPRKDAERERGMTAFVGRLRPCHVFDYKFVVLSHNTIRGAAGAAVLNAELMHSEGMLD